MDRAIDCWKGKCILHILLVASAPPNPHGTGWNRRVYQIKHDLEAHCDAEVEVFDVNRAVAQYVSSRDGRDTSMIGLSGMKRTRDRILNERTRLLSNPLRLLTSNARFSTDKLRGAALDCLRDFVDRRQPFDAMVCDNVLYANAVTLMSESGVPSYYALHHIESLNHGQRALLDVTRGSSRQKGRPTKELLLTCGDLADEIAALAPAEAVYAISRFEHEFLAATGIKTSFYPYEPVGETLEWCDRIRSARVLTPPSDPKIFLSSGTPNGHNEESLAILMRVLLPAGMPSGKKLVVTGMEKEDLISSVEGLEGLRRQESIYFAGMLPRDEFDELLVSAAGMVIPRYFGFGALTRFADAAACGIPVLTNVTERVSGLSDHHAVVVEDETSWRDAIQDFSQAQALSDVQPLNDSYPDIIQSPLQQIKRDYFKRGGLNQIHQPAPADAS